MPTSLSLRRLARRRFLALVPAGLALAALPASALAAGAAEDYVESVGNRVIAAARAKSVSQFRSLLRANADIRAIGLYSLGPYRKSLTKNVQSEYFSLVEGYISKIFAQNAKKLAGQKLVTTGTKDAGDSVLVRSELQFSGGGGYPVTWRLVKRGGGFRIFDVNVDGVWLASTQKTNFVSVLKKSGGKIEALLDYLRQ
ncbi:MAG: phospholipid-binding protein MlaC [Parvibaculaceae bacterium]